MSRSARGRVAAVGAAGTQLSECVYVRGSLACHDDEVLAPAGSGRFVARTFRAPGSGATLR